MAKSAPNYTEAQTAFAVERYMTVIDEPYDVRKAMVQEIADELQKSPRSIVSKLSREDVYKAKEAVSKVTGEAPAKKLELAANLIEVSGVDTSVVDPESVSKMRKLEIQAFIDAFETREV